MYELDLNTCSAIDVITRSFMVHPSLITEAVNDSIATDRAYAADKTGQTYVAIMSRANHAEAALKRCEEDDFLGLKHLTGGSIILFNIACKLQLIPAHIRTAIAVRTWPEA